METHRIPAERVLGHREVPGAATACPGRYLDLAQLRSALGATSGSAGSGPSGYLGESDAAKAAPRTLWRVQAGAFSSRQAAETHAQKLRELGLEALVVAGTAKK